jgi:hypothetical protein
MEKKVEVFEELRLEEFMHYGKSIYELNKHNRKSMMQQEQLAHMICEISKCIDDEDNMLNHLTNTCAMLFDLYWLKKQDSRTVHRYYQDELVTWSLTKITDSKAFIFSIVSNIVEVQMTGFRGQSIGESLGKIFALALKHNINLIESIDLYIVNKNNKIN